MQDIYLGDVATENVEINVGWPMAGSGVTVIEVDAGAPKSIRRRYRVSPPSGTRIVLNTPVMWAGVRD